MVLAADEFYKGIQIGFYAALPYAEYCPKTSVNMAARTFCG